MLPLSDFQNKLKGKNQTVARVIMSVIGLSRYCCVTCAFLRHDLYL